MKRIIFRDRFLATVLSLSIFCLMIGYQGASGAEALSSKDAYAKLLEDLKQMEHGIAGGSSMEKILEVFDRIEKKLEDFIAAYPGTDEAQDAKFQLGMLNSNINKADKAEKYLQDYITSSPNAPREKLGYANFFLAQAYKSDEQFGKAKKYYLVFLDKYSDVDAKLASRAKSILEDMDVLKKLAVGNKPIPFKVKDIEGKPLSLDKYKGKVVLLDFWATWCGPCRQEMPNVIKLYDKHHDKGFEIVGISLDSKKDALLSYLKTKGIKWPQYFDGAGWKNSVAMKYRIRSIPTTFLLDRKGKIRYKSLRGRELERAVEKLLREK